MGYPHIRGTVVAAEWQPSFIHLAKYIIERYSGQALAFESADKPPESLHNSNSTLKTSLIGISLRSVIWIIPATASIRLTSPVTVW